MSNIQQIEELANKMNVDYNNPDELKSLQLALQLQAEEQQEFSNNLPQIDFNGLMQYINEHENNAIIEEEKEPVNENVMKQSNF